MSEIEAMEATGLGRLKGKVALITGGGNGIGEASARLFVNEDAQVAIADLNTDGAARVANEINDAGGTATAIQLDVTDNDSCAAAVDAAIDRFGRVDVLVNSAGVGSRSAPDMTYEERWQFVIDVNLKGTVLMTRHAVGQMKEQGSGAVVNIASIRGLIGYPAFITDGFNPYPHSKGGVVNMAVPRIGILRRFSKNCGLLHRLNLFLYSRRSDRSALRAEMILMTSLFPRMQ